MITWIDANPWAAVVIFFATGAFAGLLLRLKRRRKYAEREAGGSPESAA